MKLPVLPRRRDVLLPLLAAPFATPLLAQDAARPIRLVVPFAPGGATDVIGRMVAQKLGEDIKGNVIVDNRPGAGSVLGSDAVAKATPDGLTLLMSNGAAFTTGPHMRNSMPYRPFDDFTHLVLIGTFPNAFVVRADHPSRTFADFIARAKQLEGKVNYSSAGIGSAGFLTGELLKQLGKLQMTHVAYKGTGPATIDLLGGQIDAMFDGVPTALAQARAGKVRVLAVTGDKRIPAFPDAPPMSEVVPGVVGEAWFGISLPAAVPRPVTDRLETQLLRVLAQPDVRARLIELGMTPIGAGRQEFATFLRAENQRWEPLLKAANIRIE